VLLENKVAIIYGAGGAVGGAVASAFAREGAKVLLTGRDPGALEPLATRIQRDGGTAALSRVDALDEDAVESHAAAVVREHGSVDVSFNAIGIPQPGIQGVPLVELPVESFLLPVATYARAHFITARAAARRMREQRSGVILLHTPEPARIAAPLVGGMGPAWAAMEALSRGLSAELGPYGVRTVCVRTTGLPETSTIDVVFGLHARALGVPPGQFRAAIEGMTHRRRSTTLVELGDVAAFLVSDRASAMTGAVANLTGGLIAD
jgi:NAD(P)-dependent dehydrogenase (short-subunit alcohol dehydrogenase family)